MTQDETQAGSPLAGRGGAGVPAAIVIAGALVALAIYFGGQTPAKAPQAAGVQATGAPVAAVEEPTEPPVGNLRAVSDADHVRGPAAAKVTIVEYSDTECPFCKRFHGIMQDIMKDNPNDVRWVYRHAPLEQLHKKAFKEAVAAECAGEQGKFWEMLDLVYATTNSNDSLDPAQLPVLAQQSGVANIAQFNSCLGSTKYDQRIRDDLNDFQAAGGQGTPYSVAIGPDGSKTPINGAQPVPAVQAVISALVKK